MHVNKSFNQRNILEKLDMFGIDISIRFCKQILHKTSTGGIFTILVLGLILLQVIVIIQQFIDKTNPLVLYQQNLSSSPERFDLKQELFTFAFGLMDQKSVIYSDDSIYRISLQLRVQKRVFNSTKNGYDLIQSDRYVKTVQCTGDHFRNPQTRDYFLQLDYKSLHCIDLSENEIFIEGQFEGPQYARLQLMVDICQNSTTSTKYCKPQDQIDKKLTNNRLTLFHDDYAVISRDRDNPFQAVGKQTFWISGPTLYKNTNLSFRNIYLYTDTGIVMQDIEKKRIISYSSDKEQTTPRSTNRLYDCFIAHEKNIYQEYHRSYMKIDKALSQIGGIYNILFTLGCLICKPISQAELNRKLLSSLFSFVNSDEGENSEDKSPQKKEQQQQLQNEASVFNNENNISSIMGQIKKTETTINNHTQFDHTTTEGNQLIKQQSNKQETQDQKLINLKKFYSDVNHNNDLVELTNQKNNNTCITNQKMETDDQSIKQDVSKINFNLGISITKTQACKDSDTLKRSQFGKNSNFLSMFRKKNTSVQNNDIIKNMNFLQQQFNSATKEIKFKSIEFFISSFQFLRCLRRRRYDVLKYGIEKLYQHIDIFYITTKLIELEKLKSLLLNQQQLKMFEFIPRPVLKFSNSGKTEAQTFCGIQDDNKDWYDKMIEAQKALNDIVNKSSTISYIDKRLIEILYPKFKNINLSQLNDTSKEIKENADQIISNTDIEDISEIDVDRNRIRYSEPIQEKDFKNMNLSQNKIIN